MKRISLTLAFIAATVSPALAAPISPLAIYTFENGLVTDDSGNGNTGTDLGGVSLLAGAGHDGGTAAQFSALAGRTGIDTGIDINRGVLAEMTMGAWVNLTSLTGIPKVLSHDDFGYDRSLGVDYRGDDPGVGFAAFTGSYVADAPGTATTGSWVHLAVVYSGASSALYLNGSAAASFTDLSAANDSVFNLHIGTNPGFNEDWIGLVDDVFVYGRALSASDIGDIYANGFGAAPIPLPAGLPLLLAGLGGLALVRRKKRC
ncbi:LamG domain-containing protein [Lutimaribacter saemankumensis]|uniref:VPLPA-CTERM protein sorting domain-containing protein n=1 Tax=Lutimaribacter saemankumensis TaxID=490829 RepID=A0A1G8LMR4_9RHOB|nr:LamG domain-containing protein [Lutimaribacter saemankumensis]SDI56500.1 VPLPA-CTERM protein sorting domain-containing protein [Lutimaribacter saemankumensis]